MTRSRYTGDVGHRAYKKNYLINGNMGVSQRGTSFNTIDAYKIDRWRSSATGTGTVEQISNLAAAPAPTCLQIATADGTGGTYTAIELGGVGVSLLEIGKEYTLSYYYYLIPAQGTGSIRGTVSTRDAITGGNQVTMADEVQVATGAGSWQRHSITLTALAPAATNEVLVVTITDIPYQCLLTAVQLEEGSTATDFEYVSPQQNLAECQRYFQVGYLAIGDNSAMGGPTVNKIYTAYYPVAMRVAPTAVQYNTSLLSVSSLVFTTRTDQAQISVAYTGGDVPTGRHAITDYTLDAEL